MAELDASLDSCCRYLAVSISQIMSARRLAPQTAFKTTAISNLRVRVFNPKDKIGARIIEKVNGVKDAISRRYLDQLLIVVGNNREDLNDSLEVYYFKVIYRDDGSATVQITSQEACFLEQFSSTDKQKDLKRSLMTLRYIGREVLPKLPDDAFASLRITYTDGTPHGYQCSGFHRHEKEELYVLREEAAPVVLSAVDLDSTQVIGGVMSTLTEDPEVLQSIVDEFDVDAQEIIMNMSTARLNDSVASIPQRQFNETATPGKTPGRTNKLTTITPPTKQKNTRATRARAR